MISTEQIQFNNLIKDDFACNELARSICASRSTLFNGERIYEGSRILYKLHENKIVKIFSSDELSFCENEAEYLTMLNGRLNVTTPELITNGVHNNYPFLIMQKLEGSLLRSVWNELPHWEKKQILTQIAHVLKKLHSLPCNLTKSSRSSWNSFIGAQAEQLTQNHKEFGLGSDWTTRISNFIENTEAIEYLVDPVICHTEIMQEHLFVRKHNGSFRITGLIDFEPSMIAIPEYDFCSVGLFICAGERGLFKHFLESYGYSGNSKGIMRMLLLHRYSNMKWFMSTIPQSISINSIEDLCDYWFGV